MCLPAYGSEFYKLTEAERDQVVGVAVEANGGRIPVVAQANHVSSRAAAELARRYTGLGADVISFAIPRQFGSSDADIVDYCAAVAAATPRPILIQDFNPGGPTMGADLISALHDRCGNFRFVKLEDPMMVDRLISIRSATGDGIGILEGWGGLYMLEGVAAGIDGIMPGAAIADLLDSVFAAAESQSWERAHDLFGALLPYISFSLQDFELFLQMEKRALVRRGLIVSPTVRALSQHPERRGVGPYRLPDRPGRAPRCRGLRSVLVEDRPRGRAGRRANPAHTGEAVGGVAVVWAARERSEQEHRDTPPEPGGASDQARWSNGKCSSSSRTSPGCRRATNSAGRAPAWPV